MASTGTGKACAPYWTNASREWSKKLPCFTRTDWHTLDLNSWSTSLRRTMSSSWWSVTTLEPILRQAKPSRLLLTQHRNLQMISSRLPASSWQDIMGCALRRIDESVLPEGELQPWRKQQQAKMKTAQKKANCKKAAMRKTAQKKTAMLASDEATRREPEIQMKEDEKKGGQTRKCKRKRKEHILLIEEPKEAHEKKDEDENEGDAVVPYDGKCRKVHILFSK